MPIKLNVSQAAYAQVAPEFTAALKEVWKERWKALNDDILAQPPSYHNLRAKSSAPVMSRLRGLCTNKDLLDKEISRLRGLPYDTFSIREYGGRAWLVGLTRPVQMNDGARRYQAPRYFVYMPTNVCIQGTNSPFHFVPEGYEMITSRHPHHKARSITPNDADPLDMSPSTCWGSFGTIATNCLKAGDIVDLFRNIGIYLTRIDQNSLLVHPFDAVYFLQDIGPYTRSKVRK